MLISSSFNTPLNLKKDEIEFMMFVRDDGTLDIA